MTLAMRLTGLFALVCSWVALILLCAILYVFLPLLAAWILANR